MNVPYHDAKLNTIQITQNGDIALSFRSLTGDKFHCTLRGVKHFCCDNFREGNTVLDRRSSESTDARDKDMRKLLFLRASETSQELHQLHDAIDKGALAFYKLCSSYGAVVLAVCEDVLESAGKR